MPGSSRRPRVVLNIHRLSPAAPTGVHRFVTEIATALAGEVSGYDIELLSGRDRSAPPADLPMRVIHPIVPRRLLHLSWMSVGLPRVERLAGAMDLFHPLTPFAPTRSKAPQVATIHDLTAIHHPTWNPGFTGDGIRKAIRYQSETAAAVVVPSTAVADDLTSTLGTDPNRIRIVPYAASGMFATPVPEALRRAALEKYGVADQPYLIVVGAVSERKNLGVLFEALAALKASGTTAPMLVIAGGDDVGAEAIHAGPERHGVADLVRFTGWVPEDTLLALLSGATALVHPSWYEGFGLTPLEAMVAGIPVIASNRGAVPEVVADAGLLGAPDEANEWATAIERLLTEPGLRDELVSRGRERAAEFTWPRAARQILDIYDEVLDRTSQ